MKKVALITGVTGQDGSYLAELLVQKGYEVHGLIRRISTGPNTVNIDHIKDKIHLHYSDMSDGSNLRNLVLSIKPDEVYNLAAQSQVGVSFETPEFTAEVNAVGVLNILEAIRSLKSEKQCKFYQASTSELYGKVVETPQTEKTPFYPRSPYAVAKLYAYWITVNYRESYGLFTCNGILFNHESPRRGPEFVTRKIVQGMIRTYLGKQKYLELGNLDARRDWGHAKDYVNAMWLMMQKEIPEDYVISSGEEHSVREFCESVANYLDINIKWVGGGLDEVGTNAKTGEVLIKINKDLYRPAEVATLFGDCSKAKKLLNWKPVYNFNALVHEMCEKEMEMQTLTHDNNPIKSQPVNDLPKVLEFGSYYVSDFLEADKTTFRSKYSLDLYLDTDLGAVRLNKKDLAPASSMWGKYWYRSGTNATMTNELKGIVNEICSRVKLKDDDIWLDIACNDGTLMKFIPDNIKKVGIDPCNDSFYAESSKHGEVIQDYFSERAWKKTSVANKKAKVITCIAMFYDLDNPHSFVDDLSRVLDEDGLLVLQMSYTPLMIKQMAFDNICHEHVYYYDLTSIQNLFFRHGFKIVDCSINDTNGGSFRVYLQKTFSQLSSFGSAPLRDVCDMRIDSILNYEKNELNIRDTRVWEEFGKELRILQKTIVDFVNDAVSKGKTVYGYGASTKGNTLLQHFGLDHTKIKAIAERSPYKFGMKTVGTEIPIISEDEMRKANPDYLLVLPWHFIDEFERREQDYINAGGALVVPCPKFKIISK